MKLIQQIAKQFEEVQLNGNWVSTNLKEQLSDVTVEEANTKIGSLNTIALLTFHINYYVAGLIHLFEQGSLDIKDKFSFDMPNIDTQSKWEEFLAQTFEDAEKYCSYLRKMNDEQLNKVFVDEKYGTYFRNLHGMIEHSYYHLGQIVLLKKLIREQKQTLATKKY